MITTQSVDTAGSFKVMDSPGALSIDPKNKKKLKILLIDDDIEMSEIVKNCLSFRYNCKVDVASDPFEAMNTMTDKFYDLIILDWRLPALTGGQTLKELEKGFYFEPELPLQWDRQRVPVVILSGSEKAKCHLYKTKHFDCIGFVSKRQSLHGIVDSFESYIQLANEKYSSVG